MNYKLAYSKFSTLSEEIATRIEFNGHETFGDIDRHDVEDFTDRTVTLIKNVYNDRNQYKDYIEIPQVMALRKLFTNLDLYQPAGKLERLKAFIINHILHDLQFKMDNDQDEENIRSKALDDLRKDAASMPEINTSMLDIQSELEYHKDANKKLNKHIENLNQIILKQNEEIEYHKGLQQSYSLQTTSNSKLLEDARIELASIHKELKEAKEELTKRNSFNDDLQISQDKIATGLKQCDIFQKHLSERFLYWKSENDEVPTREVKDHYNRCEVLVKNVYGEKSNLFSQLQKLIADSIVSSNLDKIHRLYGFVRNILYQDLLMKERPSAKSTKQIAQTSQIETTKEAPTHANIWLLLILLLFFSYLIFSLPILLKNDYPLQKQIILEIGLIITLTVGYFKDKVPQWVLVIMGLILGILPFIL